LPLEDLFVNQSRVRVEGGQMLSAALLLGIVALATSVVVGEHGVTHLMRLRAERQALTEGAFVLLQRNQGLRSEIDRLRTDDLYLEELARRRLGLVRPKEFVYRFRGDER
jgi:cell division protein FtsB